MPDSSNFNIVEKSNPALCSNEDSSGINCGDKIAHGDCYKNAVLGVLNYVNLYGEFPPVEFIDRYIT